MLESQTTPSTAAAQPPAPPTQADPATVSGAAERAPDSPPGVIMPGPDPEVMYQQGMSFLAGIGAQRSNEQAISAFLNASDYGHAEAAFKAALMYFNGVGISRNDGEARALAKRSLDLGLGSALQQRYARELADGTLGTANATRLLEQDETAIALSEEDTARRKKRLQIAGGLGAFVLIAGVAAALLISRANDRLDAPPAAGVAGLISSAEAGQAERDAAEAIARLKAEANGAVGDSEGSGQGVRKTDF